jgi:hypothetical protein
VFPGKVLFILLSIDTCSLATSAPPALQFFDFFCSLIVKLNLKLFTEDSKKVTRRVFLGSDLVVDPLGLERIEILSGSNR